MIARPHRAGDEGCGAGSERGPEPGDRPIPVSLLMGTRTASGGLREDGRQCKRRKRENTRPERAERTNGRRERRIY